MPGRYQISVIVEQDSEVVAEQIEAATTLLAGLLADNGGTVEATRLMWSSRETDDVAVEAPLPHLGAWRCSSCAAPMIGPLAPGTLETLECPVCSERRTITESRSIRVAIERADRSITEAITTEPISPRTRAELADATTVLRHLSASLSG